MAIFISSCSMFSYQMNMFLCGYNCNVDTAPYCFTFNILSQPFFYVITVAQGSCSLECMSQLALSFSRRSVRGSWAGSVLGLGRVFPLPPVGGCLLGALSWGLMVGRRGAFRLCRRINFSVFFPEYTLVGLIKTVVHGLGEDVKKREFRTQNYC